MRLKIFMKTLWKPKTKLPPIDKKYSVLSSLLLLNFSRSRSVALNTNGDDLISDKAYLIALLENIHDNHSRTPRLANKNT